jgi:hypothetical protein
MKSTPEINALLNLLDDPDEVVFDSVSNKLLSYGEKILPNLWRFHDNTLDENLHLKVMSIINQLNMKDVFADFKKWANTEKKDILEAMLIMEKFDYYYSYNTDTRKAIKNIYQSAWLEMNNYLAPMEQVNVLASVIYNMYKFNGNAEDSTSYGLNSVLASKNGNPYSLNALYLIICQLLNIPIAPVNIPGQNLLAYFDTVYNYLSPQLLPQQKILFYIDASNGMVYTQMDIDVYVKKSNIDFDTNNLLEPVSNLQFIINYLKQYNKVSPGLSSPDFKLFNVSEIILMLENIQK